MRNCTPIFVKGQLSCGTAPANSNMVPFSILSIYVCVISFVVDKNIKASIVMYNQGIIVEFAYKMSLKYVPLHST